MAELYCQVISKLKFYAKLGYQKGVKMKKHIITMLVAVLAFTGGYSLNNKAISGDTDYKIAVVDVQQLVANSNEVKKLKAEQEKKMQTMQSTLEKARTDIAKETDPEKIKTLEEKYRNDINKQKQAMEQEYNAKFDAIDKNIRNAVVEKARSMNYNLVLPKNIVLLGGDDITNQVAPAIK